MNVEVTEQGLLIPKELLEGIDEVEIRQEQNTIVIIPIILDHEPQRTKRPRRMKLRSRKSHLQSDDSLSQSEQQTMIDKDAILAQLAEFDRIAAEISAVWPEGVSAVDTIRDVRREL